MNTKTMKGSAFMVVACNIVIAVAVYFIVSAEPLLSIGLIVAAMAGILVLDRYNKVKEIFSLYIRHKRAALLSGAVMLLILPVLFSLDMYVAHMATTAVIYCVACLGLNFQMGSTDMTNFAPAAFMSIGAYTVAICSSMLGWSVWAGMVLGIVLSGAFGIIIGLPTLKTKGYYLSLVTMAVQIALTEFLKAMPSLGGSDGIPGIERYSLFGFSLYSRQTILGIRFAPHMPYLFFCILVLILCVYIAMRVYHTKSGLSLNTIAQDQIAANCMGVHVARQKLFAFVIGGMFCGMAGTLFAGLEGLVNPDSYGFAKSLMLICMVILGGMDNSIGIITGAFLLTIINEKVRIVDTNFSQLSYGLILVIMLIVRPNGLIPRRVRDYCAIAKRTIVLQAEAVTEDTK